MSKGAPVGLGHPVSTCGSRLLCCVTLLPRRLSLPICEMRRWTRRSTSTFSGWTFRSRTRSHPGLMRTLN